ncbi:MAG: hypothetical protein WCJ93_00010 [Methanomicrobiales archaeon]
MNKKVLYSLIGLTVWVFLIILFMVLSYQINLEIFFVLWLIGLLIVTELISGSTVQPSTIKYLKYFIAIQVVIFGIMVAGKVLEILNK